MQKILFCDCRADDSDNEFHQLISNVIGDKYSNISILNENERIESELDHQPATANQSNRGRSQGATLLNSSSFSASYKTSELCLLQRIFEDGDEFVSAQHKHNSGGILLPALKSSRRKSDDKRMSHSRSPPLSILTSAAAGKRPEIVVVHVNVAGLLAGSAGLDASEYRSPIRIDGGAGASLSRQPDGVGKSFPVELFQPVGEQPTVGELVQMGRQLLKMETIPDSCPSSSDPNLASRGCDGGPVVFRNAPSKTGNLVFIGAGSVPPFWQREQRGSERASARQVRPLRPHITSLVSEVKESTAIDRYTDEYQRKMRASSSGNRDPNNCTALINNAPMMIIVSSFRSFNLIGFRQRER